MNIHKPFVATLLAEDVAQHFKPGLSASLVVSLLVRG
jgi:hypothetical protein